jgi:hypothetical protein
LNFYPDKYDLKPLPEKREKGKVNRDKKGEKFL